MPALTPPEAEDPRKLSSRHILGLDGLRGLAVLIVILHHLSDYFPHATPIQRLLVNAMYPGWCGVDLFFVLSGFLITGILLDTRGSANYFRAFYARRALRIFPLYYFVLTTILLLAHFFVRMNDVLPVPHDRPFYFVYLNNWWPFLRGTWNANIIGHFWSLAVEEQFYLFWSVCVFLIPASYIGRSCLLGIAVAIAIRFVIYSHAGWNRDIVENTFARMDSLLVGASIATLIRRPPSLRRWSRTIYRSGALAAVLAIYLLLEPAAYWASLWLYSLLAVAFGALILHVFESDGRRSFAQRALLQPNLRQLGRYSYGMYIYHVPILWAESKLLRHFAISAWSLLAFVLASFFSTYLVAKLSFELFESRFLRLKRYFRAEIPKKTARQLCD